jgi:hypothetical protein
MLCGSWTSRKGLLDLQGIQRGGFEIKFGRFDMIVFGTALLQLVTLQYS